MVVWLLVLASKVMEVFACSLVRLSGDGSVLAGMDRGVGQRCAGSSLADEMDMHVNMHI